MRRVTVEVTAEDIAAGEHFACDRCPIAIAVKRCSGEPFASVTHYRIRLSPDGDSRVAKPPAAVGDFIWAFDQGHPVQPFSFEVELP